MICCHVQIGHPRRREGPPRFGRYILGNNEVMYAYIRLSCLASVQTQHAWFGATKGKPTQLTDFESC